MANEGIGGRANRSFGDLGPGEAMAAAHALSLPADQFGNDPNVEMIWAMKAYQHAEVYFNNWRPFCMRFDGVVEDFNYGTLLRLDCKKDYTDENTIFSTRIQFLAIEIARNREGLNHFVFSKAAKAKAEQGTTEEERTTS